MMSLKFAVVLLLVVLPSSVRSQTCFSNITDLLAAQQAQVDLISGGADPAPPYNFELCADTIFDVAAEGEFSPQLGGMTLSCGTSGAVTENCVFSGGAVQVRISDSTVAGYTIDTVVLEGVTFEQFDDTAIIVEAADTTTFTCDNCFFQNFDAVAALTQAEASGGIPATVQLLNGQITNGAASGAFVSNSGGSFTMDSFFMTGLDALVFITTDGATGTTTISNTDITGNTVSGGDFNAIVATNGAFTEFVDSSLSDNSGMQVGVGAFSGSTVVVSGSQLDRNSAVAPSERQSVVGGYNNSTATVISSSFTDNTNYLGIQFCIFESLCIGDVIQITGGQAIVPIFISEFSDYSYNNTFADGITAIVCEPPPDHLIVFTEDPGFSCFVGNGDCFGTCRSADNRDPTPSPTVTPVSPTVGPGPSPTSAPGPPAPTNPPGPGPTPAPVAPTPPVTMAPSVSSQPSLAPSVSQQPSVEPTDGPDRENNLPFMGGYGMGSIFNLPEVFQSFSGPRGGGRGMMSRKGGKGGKTGVSGKSASRKSKSSSSGSRRSSKSSSSKSSSSKSSMSSSSSSSSAINLMVGMMRRGGAPQDSFFRGMTSGVVFDTDEFMDDPSPKSRGSSISESDPEEDDPRGGVFFTGDFSSYSNGGS